jgi:hypothetical protein
MGPLILHSWWPVLSATAALHCKSKQASGFGALAGQSMLWLSSCRTVCFTSSTTATGAPHARKNTSAPPSHAVACYQLAGLQLASPANQAQRLLQSDTRSTTAQLGCSSRTQALIWLSMLAAASNLAQKEKCCTQQISFARNSLAVLLRMLRKLRAAEMYYRKIVVARWQLAA